MSPLPDRTEPLDEAVDDRDVTLALTVPQLIALALGVIVGLRLLQGLRERQMKRASARRADLRRWRSRLRG